MGFPRKDDDMRLYKDKDGTYFLLLVGNGTNGAGQYDAIANVYEGLRPSLGSTSIGRDYLTKKWPTRVQWSDMPKEWQTAFRRWFNKDDAPPEQVRGLWRVGEMPKAKAATTKKK